MADGRRNNRGIKGKAGRKPKAEEVQIIEKMDAALAPSEAWEALANRVAKGDVQAIKLWLAYRYGQPKQDVKLSGDGSVVNIQLPKEK
jgi:hypothetical protein